MITTLERPSPKTRNEDINNMVVKHTVDIPSSLLESNVIDEDHVKIEFCPYILDKVS